VDRLSIRKGNEGCARECDVVEVKIVARNGHSVLIEWVDNGNLYRGILPASSIRGDGYVQKKELKRAAPYGVPWEEVVILQATSDTLAQELRKRGIWTALDLQDRPAEAQGAIMAAYGIDYQTLLRIAHREAKHGN
jgi:hypothetical protein